MRRAARWRCLLLAAVCLVARVSHGQTAHELSPYEQQSLEIALERTDSSVDPGPDGKRIEAIEFVRLEVLEQRDPLPKFIRVLGNAIHVETTEQFLQRELLFARGEAYDQRRIDETERNLRRYTLQFSVVVIVAVAGASANSVRIVVITKDVWSLRLNSDVSGFGTQANAFVLQPAETNLLGTGQTVLADVALNPYSYWLGAGYVHPRIGGSQIALRSEAAVALTCESGKTEGHYIAFRYGKPLYTTHTRWAWQTAISQQSSIRRVQGDYSLCSEPKMQQLAVPAVDDPRRILDVVPSNIRTDTTRGQIALTRSFGVRIKNDIGFGAEAARFVERTEDLSSHDPTAAERFRDLYLGRSDTRLGPYAQYHAYTTDFHRVINVETLGLQEDFRLGHELFLRAYPALNPVASTRSLLGLFASFAYTLPMGDGLARPWSSVDMQLSQPDESDGEVAAGLRLVSPSLGFLRAVVDGRVRHRFWNYFNPVVQLTGANRLRGYSFRGFSGTDYMSYNFELRTAGLNLYSVLFGLTAFYDIGDAFDEFQDFQPKHGAGGGLRVVFPQGQRQVFRVDVAFPLSAGPETDLRRKPGVVFAFEQAFTVPRPTPDALIVE